MPKIRKDTAGGFTLLELVLVVTILTILAIIVIPRFVSVIQASNEISTKGKLGAIRSALSVYYADMNGTFPADLSPFMVAGNKYLDGTPSIYTANHGTSNSNNTDLVTAVGPTLDSGRLGYVIPGSIQEGTVWVECTHTDAKGKIWSLY